MSQNSISICRCPWVLVDKSDYVEYHDKEWGGPVYNDRVLFEFLTLEAFQAGLSFLEQLFAMRICKRQGW